MRIGSTGVRRDVEEFNTRTTGFPQGPHGPQDVLVKHSAAVGLPPTTCRPTGPPRLKAIHGILGIRVNLGTPSRSQGLVEGHLQTAEFRSLICLGFVGCQGFRNGLYFDTVAPNTHTVGRLGTTATIGGTGAVTVNEQGGAKR
jgi:hypothetical protein